MVCYAIGTAGHGLSKERKATLVLEDGTEFRGFVFGATVSVPGEVGMFLIDSFLVNVVAKYIGHSLTCNRICCCMGES